MHMCSVPVLKSVVRLSMLKSLNGLQESWFRPEEIADAVLGRTDLKELLKDMNLDELSEFRSRFLIPHIMKEQNDWDFSKFEKPVCADGESRDEALSLDEQARARKKDLPEQVIRGLQEAETDYSAKMGSEKLETVKKIASETLEHVFNMCSGGKLGLAVQSDVDVRTNYSVFSIIGPHLGTYGEAQVVLVMRPEVMCHPDFNMTMYAASGYCARKDQWYHAGYGDNRTEWTGPMTDDRDESRRVLCREKYSGASPMWSAVGALEWMCRVYWHSHAREGKLSRRTGPIEFNDITLEHVKELMRRFADAGTHTFIEGHIPNAMPLDYVEGVILKKSALAELCSDPITSQFLMRFKNAGRPFLTVVNDDTRMIWSAAFNYIDQLVNVNKTYGFSFLVPKETESDIYIPVRMKEDKVMITFCAVGGSFRFDLSNFPDIADPVIKEKDQLAFSFNHETGILEAKRQVSVGGSPSQVEPLFSGAMVSSTCPPVKSDEAVYWGFLIDYKKKEAFVKFIGTSSVHGAAELKISFDKLVQSPRFMSFLPNGKDVSICNLYYYSSQFDSFFPGK